MCMRPSLSIGCDKGECECTKVMIGRENTVLNEKTLRSVHKHMY